VSLNFDTVVKVSDVLSETDTEILSRVRFSDFVAILTASVKVIEQSSSVTDLSDMARVQEASSRLLKNTAVTVQTTIDTLNRSIGNGSRPASPAGEVSDVGQSQQPEKAARRKRTKKGPKQVPDGAPGGDEVPPPPSFPPRNEVRRKRMVKAFISSLQAMMRADWMKDSHLATLSHESISAVLSDPSIIPDEGVEEIYADSRVADGYSQPLILSVLFYLTKHRIRGVETSHGEVYTTLVDWDTEDSVNAWADSIKNRCKASASRPQLNRILEADIATPVGAVVEHGKLILSTLQAVADLVRSIRIECTEPAGLMSHYGLPAEQVEQLCFTVRLEKTRESLERGYLKATAKTSDGSVKIVVRLRLLIRDNKILLEAMNVPVLGAADPAMSGEKWIFLPASPEEEAAVKSTVASDQPVVDGAEQPSTSGEPKVPSVSKTKPVPVPKKKPEEKRTVSPQASQSGPVAGPSRAKETPAQQKEQQKPPASQPEVSNSKPKKAKVQLAPEAKKPPPPARDKPRPPSTFQGRVPAGCVVLRDLSDAQLTALVENRPKRTDNSGSSGGGGGGKPSGSNNSSSRSLPKKDAPPKQKKK